MGGGEGKKDVNAKLTTNEIQNKPPKTKSTDSYAKPTITDAKPTVIP